MLEQYRQFFDDVYEASRRANTVRTNEGQLEVLPTVWPFEEIAPSLELRDEWDIQHDLIPFAGDWHDLLCLDSRDGSIHLVDDTRQLVFKWDSTTSFLSALSKSKPGSEERNEIEPIDVWYADDL